MKEIQVNFLHGGTSKHSRNFLRTCLSHAQSSIVISYTSLGGTFNILDAAKKISGAGFKFSKASAETIASNLIKNK